MVNNIFPLSFCQQPSLSSQQLPAPPLAGESPKASPKKVEPQPVVQKPAEQTSSKPPDDLFASFEDSSAQNKSATVSHY